MTRPRLAVSDKPRLRINLWVFEERLQKVRTIVGGILTDIDDALKEIRAEREREGDRQP